MFVVGAMAWGMTLRFEPVLALLVTGVVVCTIRFLERNEAAPLVVAAVLVALAITAHPAGILALAPLVVAAPKLIAVARSRPISMTVIGTSAAALLIALVFVGSDLEHRRADALAFKEANTTVASWREEIIRYDLFSPRRASELAGYSTPLRRVSVALIALAILGLVTRRRRVVLGAYDYFPAATLCVALVLLVATPSKWPWHFGAIAGVVALAVTIELRRFRHEQNRNRLGVATASRAHHDRDRLHLGVVRSPAVERR